MFNGFADFGKSILMDQTHKMMPALIQKAAMAPTPRVHEAPHVHHQSDHVKISTLSRQWQRKASTAKESQPDKASVGDTKGDDPKNNLDTKMKPYDLGGTVNYVLNEMKRARPIF